MSTDYTLRCLDCLKETSLGVRFAGTDAGTGGFFFTNAGSNGGLIDYRIREAEVFRFIVRHEKHQVVVDDYKYDHLAFDDEDAAERFERAPDGPKGEVRVMEIRP